MFFLLRPISAVMNFLCYFPLYIIFPFSLWYLLLAHPIFIFLQYKTQSAAELQAIFSKRRAKADHRGNLGEPPAFLPQTPNSREGQDSDSKYVKAIKDPLNSVYRVVQLVLMHVCMLRLLCLDCIKCCLDALSNSRSISRNNIYSSSDYGVRVTIHINHKNSTVTSRDIPK